MSVDRQAYLNGLLATPYDRAEKNCWWFLRRVQRELFGRDLPEIPDGALDMTGRQRQETLRAHPAFGAWRQVDGPSDGAMALLSKPTTFHCGVVIGSLDILHTDEPHGVVLDPILFLREIKRWRIAYYVPTDPA